MSVQEDLAAARRCIDDLNRAVGRLERGTAGGGAAGADVRRVRTDADRLRESIALLAESAGAYPAAEPRRMQEVVIPDDPYDSTLWKNDGTDGLDDEGLGAQGRHAP